MLTTAAADGKIVIEFQHFGLRTERPRTIANLKVLRRALERKSNYRNNHRVRLLYTLNYLSNDDPPLLGIDRLPEYSSTHEVAHHRLLSHY